MKKILVCCFLLLNAIAASSQTFEHRYVGDYGKIYEVSPDEFVYVIQDDSLKQFKVYSLNLTLLNTIDIIPDYANSVTMYNLSRKLFNSDENLELLYGWYSFSPTFSCGVKIINSNNTLLFSKDTAYSVGLFNTTQGAKLLLGYNTSYETLHSVDVYSLYGTVFESGELGVNSTCTVFPNPTNNELLINFSAPNDEPNLKLSIYSLQGLLLKQLNIPQNEHAFKLSVSDFAPGTYFLRIQNNHFSTSVQKFIVK